MKMKISVKILLVVLQITMLYGKEIDLHFLSLDFEGRQMEGRYLSSLYGVKTTTQKRDNLFLLNFKPLYRDGEAIVASIPDSVDKINILEHEFDFPKNVEQSFFRVCSIEAIYPPWYKFQPTETLSLISFISFAQDEFFGKNIFESKVNDKVSLSEFNFSCFVAEDGQIFNMQSQATPKIYYISNEFENINQALYHKVKKSLKAYKLRVEKTIPANISQKLPKYAPELLTQIKLNQPTMRAYIAEAEKSTKDFDLFMKKLELLKSGDSVERVEEVLGKIDTANKTYGKKELSIERYFLKQADKGLELTITLSFKFNESKKSYELHKIF